MATESPGDPDSDGDVTDDDLTDFLGLLNELKATGCNLLVVGDARPELFTRASASLLGDPGSGRYRLLAVTDATPRSVAERLPDPDTSPRPLGETARIVTHDATPRSVSVAAHGPGPSSLSAIPETMVADPDLEGLASALVEAIDEFARHGNGLRPAELRVGLDSLGTLLDHHGADAVRQFLRTVGEHVRDHDAMAHYVLEEPYAGERVRTLADDVDAVIELRSVNPETYGHDAQQRWHVPSRNLTMDWVRL